MTLIFRLVVISIIQSRCMPSQVLFVRSISLIFCYFPLMRQSNCRGIGIEVLGLLFFFFHVKMTSYMQPLCIFSLFRQKEHLKTFLRILRSLSYLIFVICSAVIQVLLEKINNCTFSLFSSKRQFVEKTKNGTFPVFCEVDIFCLVAMTLQYLDHT